MVRRLEFGRTLLATAVGRLRSRREDSDVRADRSQNTLREGPAPLRAHALLRPAPRLPLHLARQRAIRRRTLRSATAGPRRSASGQADPAAAPPSTRALLTSAPFDGERSGPETSRRRDGPCARTGNEHLTAGDAQSTARHVRPQQRANPACPSPRQRPHKSSRRPRRLHAAPHHNRELGRHTRPSPATWFRARRARQQRPASRASRARSRDQRRMARGPQRALASTQPEATHWHHNDTPQRTLARPKPRAALACRHDVQRVRSWPHRRAFSLAWPAILSNISVPLVGLIDTAMLGHFSDEANLGAAALGSTVLGAVFWLFSLPPHRHNKPGRSRIGRQSARRCPHPRSTLGPPCGWVGHRHPRGAVGASSRRSCACSRPTTRSQTLPPRSPRSGWRARRRCCSPRDRGLVHWRGGHASAPCWW